MKQPFFLRPLGTAMNDQYSARELYAAFERQAFARAKEMDVPLLRETLRALDDREDALAAPHADRVWQRILQRIRAAKAYPWGLTRRGFALLVAALILLLAAVALAVSNWSAIESIFGLERTQGPLSAWTLEQKQSVADALADSGYDMRDLPDLSGLSDAQRDHALTRWLGRQLDGDVTAGHYNAMVRLKGFFDGWSLTDKAWYSGLLLSAGEVQDGDFVSVVPRRGQQEADRALSLADAALRSAYQGTDANADALIPYLFYGYVYPDADTLYWRVHYRDASRGNWFTVLVRDDDPAAYTAQVVYQRPTNGQLDAVFAESTRKAQERQAKLSLLEAERGWMITWTLEQKAAFDPDYYAVPGPEAISQQQAHAIALQAYREATGLSRQETDELFVYSYYIQASDQEPAHYSVSFFTDAAGTQAVGGSVDISDEGEVLQLYLGSNGSRLYWFSLPPKPSAASRSSMALSGLPSGRLRFMA